MKKLLASIIATVLLCLGFISSTYAWFIATDFSIQNTFTSGNIEIMLAESTSKNKKMIPGATLIEDPEITVMADSEDCWLFVKIDKSATFDTFLSYEIAQGWTPVEGKSGVYYRTVSSDKNNQLFGILKNDEVHAKPEPTKEQYDALNSNNYPVLTFTAYAVQMFGFANAELAWAEAEQLG